MASHSKSFQNIGLLPAKHSTISVSAKTSMERIPPHHLELKGNYRFNMPLAPAHRSSKHLRPGESLSAAQLELLAGSSPEEKLKRAIINECDAFLLRESSKWIRDELFKEQQLRNLNIESPNLLQRGQAQPCTLGREDEEFVRNFAESLHLLSKSQLGDILQSFSIKLLVAVRSPRGHEIILHLASIDAEFDSFCKASLLKNLPDMVQNEFSSCVLVKLARSPDFCSRLASEYQSKINILFNIPQAISLLSAVVTRLPGTYSLTFLTQYLKVNLPDACFHSIRDLMMIVLQTGDADRLECVSHLIEANMKWIVDKPLGCMAVCALIKHKKSNVQTAFENLLLEYPIQTFVRKYRRICLMKYLQLGWKKEGILETLIDEVKRKHSNLSYILKKQDSMLLFLSVIASTASLGKNRAVDLVQRVEKLIRFKPSESNNSVHAFASTLRHLVDATSLPHGEMHCYPSSRETLL